MVTQVLIIHGQLPFAIKLKQTLERHAPLEVHPFTSVESAVDYLQNHVQDVALVDFATADEPAEALVAQLRAAQADLALFATPLQSDDQLAALDLQGTLDTGFSTRELIQMIDAFFQLNERPSLSSTGSTSQLGRRVEERHDLSQSAVLLERPNFEPQFQEGDTPSSSPQDIAAALGVEPDQKEQSFTDVLNSLSPDAAEEDTPPSQFANLVNSMRGEETYRPLHSRQQLVDFVLNGEMDSLIDESDEEPADEIDAAPSSSFERLAQEEPPLPSFENSGTISDLMSGMNDPSFNHVLSLLRGEEVDEESEAAAPAPPSAADFEIDENDRPQPTIPSLRRLNAFEFDSEPTPAKVILQRTLEQQMTGEFSLEELLGNIVRQLPAHRPKVLPLPSWLRESQQADDAYVLREPDFLPKELPPDLPEEIPAEPTPFGAGVEASQDLYPDQATQLARGQQVEEHPENLETEWLEQQPRSQGKTVIYPPPETLPEEIPSEPTVVHQPAAEQAPEPVASWDEPEPAETWDEPEPVAEEWGEPEPVDEMWDEPEPAETWDEPEPVAETWDEPEPEAPEAVPTDLPEMPAEPVVAELEAAPTDESGWYDLESQDFNTQFELMAAFEVVDEEMGVTSPSGALYTEVSAGATKAVASVSADAAPEAPEPEQDPYIAQLALSLTDASLELTAEAVLLTRDRQIVAFSGEMPEEEFNDLRDLIADDWDAQPGGGRIRFLTAPGSGIDYMLYSRRTEDDLTLSLIFAGTMPLRDIRRQGQRLINALLSVPEAPEATAESQPVSEKTLVAPAIVPDSVMARTPYSCVWLLRDPDAYLDAAVSQAITTGLSIQLREQQWRIHALQVREDHVYLLAEAPGDDPAYQLIRDLKRRSAEIAHTQNPAYSPDDLWSDGYLVVSPGRELDVEEIQQFINFERMG